MKKKKDNNNNYPSAVLLQSACYEDYKRLIDTYDKIYNKISIALVFCGVILLGILNSFDYTLIFSFSSEISKKKMLFDILWVVSSYMSAIFIVWALVQLLLLIRSKRMIVFNSVDIYDDEIYKLQENEAALWLIGKYTKSIIELKEVTRDKQKKFDSAVTKLLISVVSYAIFLVLQKGV